jgi:DNA-binding transcriptional LysR family regulator
MQHEIDWDDLRMLISVARAGSLAGAAGALGSHRSTVLRRIERLEARLGLRLFDRTPQGLVLTAAGERVSPTAELMSDAVDEILRSVEADHGRPACHIRLATTFNLAFGLLPCAINRFRLRATSGSKMSKRCRVMTVDGPKWTLSYLYCVINTSTSFRGAGKSALPTCLRTRNP